MDDEGDTLDISRLLKRLVEEDGLGSNEYVLRVIKEYKKFFFLTTENLDIQVLVPSAAVDMVWQRHLLDTLIYTNDCIDYDVPGGYLHRYEIYGSPIQLPDSFSTELDLVRKEDNTTKTPRSKSAQECYEDTLIEYTRYFGTPPEDIWPATVEFFAVANARQFSCIPHPLFHGLHAYAFPQAVLPLTPVSEISFDSAHTNKSVVRELTWIGEEVEQLLLLKQARAKSSTEPIAQIHFLKPKALSLPDTSDINEISLDTELNDLHHNHDHINLKQHQDQEQEKEHTAAVALVVDEYCRFLTLVMVQTQRRKTGQATFEVTPSKLVDELWHAHILRSPSYFSFWCLSIPPVFFTSLSHGLSLFVLL